MTGSQDSEPQAPDERALRRAMREAAKREARSWEARQTAPQRWLNRFCENWIFAFIVAMAIRHFAIEAYRIPTASMEPMLFGDEALAKADHVLVDKFFSRFQSPDRWDVTVFQFPWPEVAGPDGIAQPVPAWNADGDRLDSFPFNPQMNRNFVKRTVALPGDVFYLSGGDLYLRQEDGSWQVPQKPPAVQEALWLPIYRHGAQEANQRWVATDGAEVSSEGDLLRCRIPSGGRVRFDQPLWNLYVKEGPVNVAPASSPNALSRVAVSMTEPVFTLEHRGRSLEGSIWDLNQWQVHRLTTRDLDSQSHGSSINERMDEWVGDLRVDFRCIELDGELALVLSEGDLVSIRLELTPESWRVEVDGQEVAAGDGSVEGHRWRVVNLDNRARVWRDEEPLHEPVAVAPTVPERFEERTALAWIGSGTIALGGLAIDRDVHYSRSGFLEDATQEWKGLTTGDPLAKRKQELLRRQVVGAVADEALRTRLEASMEEALAGSRSYDWLRPLGESPATALRMPDGAYLLLGDNSPFSWDGRSWGWVPEANLRGEVLVAALLPIGRWKLVR